MHKKTFHGLDVVYNDQVPVYVRYKGDSGTNSVPELPFFQVLPIKSGYDLWS